jgi:hypothetical protein
LLAGHFLKSAALATICSHQLFLVGFVVHLLCEEASRTRVEKMAVMVEIVAEEAIEGNASLIFEL